MPAALRYNEKGSSSITTLVISPVERASERLTGNQNGRGGGFPFHKGLLWRTVKLCAPSRRVRKSVVVAIKWAAGKNILFSRFKELFFNCVVVGGVRVEV
jgi:hypothetical protein